MRRTDTKTTIEIEKITIILDEPGEISRWNEEIEDFDSALAYIEELCEIDCSPNHNTVFEIKPGFYNLIADYNGKIYQIEVIIE